MPRLYNTDSLVFTKDVFYTQSPTLWDLGKGLVTTSGFKARNRFI